MIEGAPDGDADGKEVGLEEGNVEGELEGETEGLDFDTGLSDGTLLKKIEGDRVGSVEGKEVEGSEAEQLK